MTMRQCAIYGKGGIGKSTTTQNLVAAYAQNTLVAIAPAFQQGRAAAAYTARTGCGIIENTHYIVQTAQKGSI